MVICYLLGMYVHICICISASGYLLVAQCRFEHSYLFTWRCGGRWRGVSINEVLTMSLIMCFLPFTPLQLYFFTAFHQHCSGFGTLFVFCCYCCWMSQQKLFSIWVLWAMKLISFAFPSKQLSSVGVLIPKQANTHTHSHTHDVLDLKVRSCYCSLFEINRCWHLEGF